VSDRPDYIGFYINLDRSARRRAAIEGQLAALGVAKEYSRFEAIEGQTVGGPAGKLSSGALGCFASHAGALRRGIAARAHVHVLEDDVLLSPELAPALRNMCAQPVLEEYDILYTDVFVPVNSHAIMVYERERRHMVRVDPQTGAETYRGVRLVELRGQPWASLSSYVVAARSVERVAELLDNELRAGPSVPVDLFVRELINAGRLRAACTIPFLTSLDLHLDLESTVRSSSGAEQRSRLASSLVRHAFYVRPDWRAVEEMVQQHIPQSSVTRRSVLLARMLDFQIFGDFDYFA
jgi:GR25 family glycosyltransferase involved in LPS biosynthesis